jgi:uncharacterized protein (TIGR02145 family)
MGYSMKNVLLLCLVFVSTSFLYSQNDVKIGNQIWMSKNLNVDSFRNGDPIKQVTSKKQWEWQNEIEEPAWCYYNFDSKNAKYGKLYNWFAVIDPRALAPNGYRIPMETDWMILVRSLGKPERLAATQLRGKYGWSNNCKEDKSRGGDPFGFNALPGGFITGLGDFKDQWENAMFWSISYESNFQINCYDTPSWNMMPSNGFGHSIRCIKD